MAKKYYVVWQGRETGIFTDWPTCKRQIDKFAGARYKSFPTQAEAEAAFGGKARTSGSSGAAAPARKRSAGQTVKTYTAAEIDKLAAEVKIFTDGGCEPNPGKAGSGIALYRNNKVAELWYGLYNPMGTNNTAELNALNQALIMAKQELANGNRVAILCDSKYSIQCVTQWAAGWKKKGWKKASGEIKNLALIQEMFERHQELKDKIQVLHVNGHVGVEGNELADRMSIHAIAEKDPQFCAYPQPIDLKAILALRAG
ncbi:MULTISPECIES: ribonuclease H family protein [unclassified Agarivorans]|uniref:ribonuclease H family protein n=1 Tax=unclassified Agarivorans TaxID=2636026 RepID=UPI0026E32084|nr:MULTISPECIES: ribonuclease H family protein [unclassified Agarivorans]MDO6684455.1 ribonuclease H family protein [Agarivorans sp. 3_MG-2023]MDO6714620.1 ribonuclease H family protein [Agarivorans sp. 2_MG-2023]